MDLLATVRKEGSRGGRGDFKWSDVQSSSHRENYLGHSLMAPVGRWQKGRDLNWYAKADSTGVDGEDPKDRAARERAEEIRRVKEAEEDALARALGLPVPPRNNPNMEAIGDKRNVGKVLKETAGEAGGIDGGKGIGFGSSNASGPRITSKEDIERIEGTAEQQDKELQYALREYRRRKGQHRRRSTSGSRSPDHDRRKHRRHEGREDHQRRRRRSRSRSRDRDRTTYSDRDSKPYERRADINERRRDRSRSPPSRKHYASREDRSFNRRRRD